ncbi:hypothetical protein AVEN_232948-1 [Araneus ventricosus]|uniref:Uncharacterized protein n=1 Tax=Araneus ventricosus TaxID=182803 RepID=A0A4Y2NFM5_ARAVE|nr:hypothetical protein AVEN_232948-1 [Araneus ventricosus]
MLSRMNNSQLFTGVVTSFSGPFVPGPLSSLSKTGSSSVSTSARSLRKRSISFPNGVGIVSCVSSKQILRSGKDSNELTLSAACGNWSVEQTE